MTGTNEDDALLRRFNALKNPNATIQPGSSSSQESAVLDLATRFHQLGGRAPSESLEPPRLAPEHHIPTRLSYWPSTEHNNEDDKTLEELLNDLGPDEQWQIDPDVEEENMKILLEEAR